MNGEIAPSQPLRKVWDKWLKLLLFLACIVIGTYLLSSWVLSGPVQQSTGLLQQYAADCRNAGGNCADLFGWDSADRQAALATAQWVVLLPLIMSCVSLFAAIVILRVFFASKGRRFITR